MMTRFNTSRPRTLVFTCAAVVCALAAPADAQSRRPTRAIFGGGLADMDQSLVVTGGMSGGVDDNVAGTSAGSTIIIDPETGIATVEQLPTNAAQFVQASGGLTYNLDRDWIQLTGMLNSVSRYYSSLEGSTLSAHVGRLDASFQVARRTTFSASQDLSYQPLLVLAGVPQLSDGFGFQQPVSLDAGVRRSDYFGYRGGAGLSHQLTRRGTFSLDYAYQQQLVTSDDTFRSQTAGVRYTHGLTRNVSLRAGYGTTRTRFPGAESVAEGRTIDMGVDFNKALGLTRRTTLTFATGASTIDNGGQNTFFATGNVRLQREIGRTWGAWVVYDRSAQFLSTFTAPVFADVINVGVGGDISRRLQFQSSVNGARANVGTTSGNGYGTYSGTVGLTYGLNRYCGVGVNYSVFRYEYADEVLRPLELPSRVSRHTVSVGLNMWFPLIERGRRIDASR